MRGCVGTIQVVLIQIFILLKNRSIFALIYLRHTMFRRFLILIPVDALSNSFNTYSRMGFA